MSLAVMPVAILLSALAAVLVYRGWRRGGRAWAAAGWLTAFGAVLPWSRALGPEIGVCYAIMVFVCLVWLAVASNMEPARAGVDSGQRPFQALQRPGGREFSRQVLLFLLSVPAAGAVTLLLTVALVQQLSWTMPAKVALVIFLYPVLWGAFSAWICAQDKLSRPALASLGILVVATLILFA